jgi:hypothetical protein
MSRNKRQFSNFQPVSHKDAGTGCILHTDPSETPRGYVLVKLSDGSQEWWKIRQVRTVKGVS